MSPYQSNQNHFKSVGNSGHGGTQSLFSYDETLIAWGWRYQPQDLAINGYADTGVAIGLQGPLASNTASIAISLDNTVDFAAFANSAASGTVTSTATNQGQLTLTNGALSGSYTASMSIDLTAYIASAHETVHMDVTDSFRLSFSGTGFTSATLATTAASGGTVEVATPIGGASGSNGKDSGTFDLASFASKILNTAQWNIAFMAGPGERLQGFGTSVLTISALSVIDGGSKPQESYFQKTERSTEAFADAAPPPRCLPANPHSTGPTGGILFHGL